MSEGGLESKQCELCAWSVEKIREQSLVFLGGGHSVYALRGKESG
jgi:hypothetical protein